MYHYDSNGKKVLRENFAPPRNVPRPLQRMAVRENYDDKGMMKKWWFWLIIVLVLAALVFLGLYFWKKPKGDQQRASQPQSFGFRFY